MLFHISLSFIGLDFDPQLFYFTVSSIFFYPIFNLKIIGDDDEKSFSPLKKHFKPFLCFLNYENSLLMKSYVSFKFYGFKALFWTGL